VKAEKNKKKLLACLLDEETQRGAANSNARDQPENETKQR